MSKEYTQQIIKRIINGQTGIHIQTEKEDSPQYYQFNGADILSIRAMVSPEPKICGILKLNCLEAFRQLGFIDGDPVKEHDQDRIDMLKDAIEYLCTTKHKDTVIGNMEKWLEEMQNGKVKKKSRKVRTKAVTMRTPNDHTGQTRKRRPRQYDLITMEACKTCDRTDPTSGGGFFCLVWCKPCRVPESSEFDDCLDYIGPELKFNLDNRSFIRYI